METAVVDGNGADTGHIIVTTIGGKNGQPKQVSSFFSYICPEDIISRHPLWCWLYPTSSIVLSDYKLHGRVCGWHRFLWCCLPGEHLFYNCDENISFVSVYSI